MGFRTRAALAVAVSCGVGVAMAQVAVPGEPAQALLPDLRPAAPPDAEIVVDDRRRGRRHLLAFPSITENVGAGPLIVRASRPNRRRHRMRAAQLVEHTDGSRRRYPRVGKLHYERSPDHSHWHYRGFMVYELRSIPDGTLVGPDVKTGFCLGDRHRIADRNVGGAAPTARFDVNCGKDKPRLLRVREGISVGWYDNYDAYLEGQYIDVTGVEAGRYTLVHRSNPRGVIRETTYENNASSALIALRRPRQGGRPRVEVLKRCEDRASCG